MKRFSLSFVLLISSILFVESTVAQEQFVLFDVTFDYTKFDADNSRPSKSHYYVTKDKLNPDMPGDWTSPIDYRNGTVHIRMEVLEKPTGQAPTRWSLCYIPNKGQGNNYGCTGTDTYTDEGVFEKNVSMTEFWENDGIIWSEGIRRMDLVIKDGDGVKGHMKEDPENYFPTKVRFTMVQVAVGSVYDENLVANFHKIDRDLATHAIGQGKINRISLEDVSFTESDILQINDESYDSLSIKLKGNNKWAILPPLSSFQKGEPFPKTGYDWQMDMIPSGTIINECLTYVDLSTLGIKKSLKIFINFPSSKS